MNITQDWKHILAHMAMTNGFAVAPDPAADSRCYIFKPGYDSFRVPVDGPAGFDRNLTGFRLNIWASGALYMAARQLRWFTFKPDPASEEWDNRRWIDRMI